MNIAGPHRIRHASRSRLLNPWADATQGMRFTPTAAGFLIKKFFEKPQSVSWHNNKKSTNQKPNPR
jgi:hypothetical protein